MTAAYRAQVVSHNASSGTIDLEISPAAGATKRVFVVLDLSDSHAKPLHALTKLTWLWQSLPPQWLVSFYALSSREVLFPKGESLHARDLESCIRGWEGSQEFEEWHASHITRGSFLLYPLRGIWDAWKSERAIQGDRTQGALVFVLTDGELLDLNPISAPTGMSIVGVLTLGEKTPGSRWPEVVPDSRAFPQGSTELVDHVQQLINPAKQQCEVVPSFVCAPRDAPDAAGTKPTKPRAIKWDFRKGPLIVSAAATVLDDSGAVIECRPRKGQASRIPLAGLATGTLGSQAAAQMDLPSATLGSKRLVQIDDARFSSDLLEHLRTQAGRGKSLEEPFVSRLRESLAAASPQHTPKRDCDAAIVVALAGGGPAISGASTAHAVNSAHTTLVVGGLYKDQTDQLFIQNSATSAKDPGFTAKQSVRVAYDIDSARWHLFRGNEQKTLAPKACEALSDLFIDSASQPCEAFYTGQITQKKTTGR